MNKQELAAQIWKGANEMRGKIEAGNYKDFILGLLFYKFLSENEVKYLKDNLGASKEDLAAYRQPRLLHPWRKSVFLNDGKR